jgi:hypothetical protein
MRRLHLFEFTDLPWYPPTFRRVQTDYLQFVATRGSGYRPLLPLFQKALQQTGMAEIVDLCSGGSGPWLRLQEQFRQAGLSVRITLTDKYPDPTAVQRWAGAARPEMEYLAEPVDALSVPPHLKGMRTLFEGFHHFRPEQARSILQAAVDARVAIAVVEASLQWPWGLLFLLLAPLATVAGYLVLTPFIRPRTVARFFWTYLMPVVPLVTCWDGVVSFLRVYSLPELKELTDALHGPGYVWERGLAPSGAPLLRFTYLFGYPA